MSVCFVVGCFRKARSNPHTRIHIKLSPGFQHV